MKSKCKEFQRLEEYFPYLKNYSVRMKTTLPYCTIISKSLLVKMNVGIYFYVKQSLSSLHDRAPRLQEVKNILIDNGKVHIKLPNGKMK